uniref:D-3-phosphoglycerate dehydrogenase n=1 Tax=Ixodes ricinus TaxID=34613 RepID=A0A147BVF8_IXORI
MALTIKKVLISDAVDASCVKILENNGVQVTLKTDFTKPELLQAIEGYDGLIVRSATKVTSDVIKAGQALKVIGRAGTGVDNIDCDAATRQGILVINAPGGNTLSAAELTCAMIVTLSREIPAATMSLKAGKWDRKTFMGNELYGKTLAIVCLGRIGKEVALRMQSFGMKTIGFDPIVPKEVSREFGVESMSLDEIWPLADYITVHTPLIPQTKDLIGKASLQKCKKGVKIINVARGGIVNEDDLLAALESGHCGGAGLDVFLEEPPKNTQLIAHPKVVCTPHLGANTKEAQLRVAQEIAEQFVALSQGKSVPGVVNAPSLSQTQVPENKPWADLCVALGKVAGAIVGSLSSGLQLELVTYGNELEKKGQFLSSAACIGVLRRLGHSQANFINGTVLASDAGVKVSHKHSQGPRFGTTEVALTVKSGQATHTFVGTVSGPALLLCAIDESTFQPCQLLSAGGLLLGIGDDSPNTLAQVIGGVVNLGVSVFSASRSSGHGGKAFYLFTTGSPVTAARTSPPVAPLKFWSYINL